MLWLTLMLFLEGVVVTFNVEVVVVVVVVAFDVVDDMTMVIINVVTKMTRYKPKNCAHILCFNEDSELKLFPEKYTQYKTRFLTTILLISLVCLGVVVVAVTATVIVIIIILYVKKMTIYKTKSFILILCLVCYQE